MPDKTGFTAYEKDESNSDDESSLSGEEDIKPASDQEEPTTLQPSSTITGAPTRKRSSKSPQLRRSNALELDQDNNELQ